MVKILKDNNRVIIIVEDDGNIDMTQLTNNIISKAMEMSQPIQNNEVERLTKIEEETIENIEEITKNMQEIETVNNVVSELIENERYVEGTRLLETQAFKKLLDAFTNARKRGLADCSIIKINPGTKDVKEASIDLQKNFRNSDYLGSLDDGYLYVLLANTNNADAGFVTGRIKDAGYSYEMIDGDVDGGAYGD